MITSEVEKEEEKEDSHSYLKLIFAYYCKLNNQKAKNIVFENFNEKAEMMNLH
jgi:hypothetical protein